MDIMYRMGWHRGEQLGFVAEPTAAGTPEIVIHKVFDFESAPEMFQTLASTRAVPIADLYTRLKRDRYGYLAPVPFLLGSVIETSLQVLRYEDIAEALAVMTSFGMSAGYDVTVWDDLTDTWINEPFHWGFMHVKLSTLQCLPEDFLEGLRISGTTDLWTSTMDKLLTWRSFFWKWNTGFSKEYALLVGSLWKTLEKALNAQALPLDFLFFFCNQIMTALDRRYCGDMTFVPVVDTSSSSSTSSATVGSEFAHRVRYRAQGKNAGSRYRKPTQAQLGRVTLQRPALAAQGFLPHIKRSHRQQT